MNPIFRIFRYLRHFPWQIGLNIFFNLLHILCNLGTYVMIVPFVELLFGGGKGLSGLFGGGNDPAPVTSAPTTQSSSGNNGGGMLGGLLGSLGSFSGNSSYSSGWTGTNNTGKLNTGVNSAARAKRTVLKGNGEDTVTFMVYLCGTDL